DIAVGGTGLIVGYTYPGEWLQYTLNVTTAGKYLIGGSFDSYGAADGVSYSIDGVSEGLSSLPVTEAYANFTLVPVNLTAGKHVFRFNFVSSNVQQDYLGNFDYFTFTKSTSTATGAVSGTVTGGKASETVYLDANNNSKLDSGELSTTTSSSGTYSFSSVPIGSYIVRQVLPTGYEQTSPASNAGISVTVTSGGSLTGKNFTDKVIPTDPSTVALQAETATLGGGAVSAKTYSGYTGTGYAQLPKNGSSVQWTTTRIAGAAVSLVFRYANGGTTNRPLSVVVNGTTLTSITCPPTGSWTTWEMLTVVATLKTGSNTIKTTATSTSGGPDLDSLTINKETPFSGAPAAFTTIQAENYDKGGSGAGYYNPENINNSGLYRPTEGVGIAQIPTADGGGYAAGYTNPGEYLNYTVSVAATGTYTLSFRVASQTKGGAFHLNVDGKNVTGELSIPATGSYDTYTIVSKTGVSLTAGTHVLQLVIDSDGAGLSVAGNFDWIKAVKT
ncbi:MAG TPA: carbohydrate-binding protein, partial [Humisphaera sp.]|nr:carbohydrate-binding protein [Humisphaera sp.]